jgi:hypothetical protein
MNLCEIGFQITLAIVTLKSTIYIYAQYITIFNMILYTCSTTIGWTHSYELQEILEYKLS